MVKKWNKETKQFDVVYPYTKVEMLDIYKHLNAPPLVIYSDRITRPKKMQNPKPGEKDKTT
jgi:hypothetical protein